MWLLPDIFEGEDGGTSDSEEEEMSGREGREVGCASGLHWTTRSPSARHARGKRQRRRPLFSLLARSLTTFRRRREQVSFVGPQADKKHQRNKSAVSLLSKINRSRLAAVLAMTRKEAVQNERGSFLSASAHGAHI